MTFDIDSEVFELVTAMLKQKAEDKYKSVVSSLLVLAKCRPERYFNVLTAVMQVVDDKQYISRYVRLCIDNRKYLVRSRRDVVNRLVVAGIVSSEQEQYEDFLDTYLPYTIIDILYSQVFSDLNRQNGGMRLYEKQIEGEKRHFQSLLKTRLRWVSGLSFYSRVLLCNEARRSDIFRILTLPEEKFSTWCEESKIDRRKTSKLKRLQREFSGMDCNMLSIVQSVFDTLYEDEGVNENLDHPMV